MKNLTTDPFQTVCEKSIESDPIDFEPIDFLDFSWSMSLCCFTMFAKSPVAADSRPHRRLSPRPHAVRAAICATLALIAFNPLLASTIEVTAADTTVKQGTLHLDVVADLKLPDKVRTALDKGVDLFFAADVKIIKKRKWFPDKDSVNLEIVRRISFHALTKKYVVDDLNFGKTLSFSNLSNALSALGKYQDVPLINQAIIDRSPDVKILIRIRLIHKKLPLPLRLKRFFSKPWKLSSDWYTWPLN